MFWKINLHVAIRWHLSRTDDRTEGIDVKIIPTSAHHKEKSKVQQMSTIYKLLFMVFQTGLHRSGKKVTTETFEIQWKTIYWKTIKLVIMTVSTGSEIECVEWSSALLSASSYHTYQYVASMWRSYPNLIVSNKNPRLNLSSIKWTASSSIASYKRLLTRCFNR